MPDPEPHRLSAAALARLIEAGELAAESVVRSCLDRIRDRDPVVRAWAWLDPEQALEAARECDSGGGRGVPRGMVLRGVPFGIKDIFDTSDTSFAKHYCNPFISDSCVRIHIDQINVVVTIFYEFIGSEQTVTVFLDTNF